MKKLLFVVSLVFMVKVAEAQTKSSVPAMPDLNKIMKMSPAEIEAYKKQVLNQTSKQIKQKAEQNTVKIDEMTLPDFEVKMPVKDMRRLQLLPSQPPTMNDMLNDLKKSIQQIESVAPKEIRDEVNAFSGKTPAEIQSASIEAFYNDRPVQALLLSMQSALRKSSEAIAWNNLSAIYNLTGLEHKAIPILMHQLQQLPDNSMLLNNMGQAYLGLGDVPKAKDYFNQCLVQDPLNPEANRSMGMICLTERNFDKSREYFEKELEVTQRESTISLIERNNFPVNVYVVRSKTKAVPDHDFFDEIQLDKFKVPPFPVSSDQTRAEIGAALGAFSQSVLKEQLFWGNEALATPDQLAKEGKRSIGLYRKQVDRLLKDLHKAYTPYDLSLFTNIGINQLKNMIDEYGAKIGAVKCPTPPAGVGNYEINMAYDKKCCDLKKPIIDAHMAKYNAYVTQRINFVSGVWKQYINKLINIVSLDPSPANRRFVCGKISEYFLFLGTACQSGQLLDPPSECHVNMTASEADSIIESSRKVNLNCPEGLKLNLKLKMINIKADCENYSLSGSYGIFKGGYSHSFKTGSSTLSAGVGLKADFFKAVGKASISQMVYVSWDNNNNFTDLGLKGGAGMGLDENLLGVDAEYTLGINSGYHGDIKPKGLILDVVNYLKK
jgi:tetratricopeptide (TPR) repeat protein